MGELFSVAGMAVTAGVLAVLLRQYKAEYAMLLSLLCCVLIFAVILSQLQPAFDLLNRLLHTTGINSEYGKILMKALGICYVVQLASDSCTEAGQTAIAGKIELAGKAAILLLSLPLFENLAAIALNLIGF